jgi:predicted nucleotidyltransferase
MTATATHAIRFDADRLTDFCQRYHIRRLGLLHSVLRDKVGADDGVDVVVEFDRGASPGYIQLAGIETELAGLLGQEVHIYTTAGLRRTLGPEDMARVEWCYAAV